MQALQYLCRHSTEEERIALRGQHRTLQTRTSDVERQGREQPVNQQGSDFERSQRKLIFDLRHALHATGHVPGICIDFPLSFRPKEEYTRYTSPIPPVTRRHRLAFLTVQVINNAIRKPRGTGEDQEASNPAHNPQYSTQICYKNYPSNQPNAHSLEALWPQTSARLPIANKFTQYRRETFFPWPPADYIPPITPSNIIQKYFANK